MNVTLQFQHVNELVAFLKKLHIANCEIHWENLTITCDLSDANRELATQEYSASVVG